jgi:type I restriction enzyme R subunit
MSPDISERAFEETVEAVLLRRGSDGGGDESIVIHETPSAYGTMQPGGYRKHGAEEYDRALCLLPGDVVDFVLATQPKEWEKLKQHHGVNVREQFLKRLSSEIGRRGALDVLRSAVMQLPYD